MILIIRVRIGTYLENIRDPIDFVLVYGFTCKCQTPHHIFRLLDIFFYNDFPIYSLWLIAYSSCAL